jgi:hypothetical protein
VSGSSNAHSLTIDVLSVLLDFVCIDHMLVCFVPQAVFKPVKFIEEVCRGDCSMAIRRADVEELVSRTGRKVGPNSGLNSKLFTKGRHEKDHLI